MCNLNILHDAIKPFISQKSNNIKYVHLHNVNLSEEHVIELAECFFYLFFPEYKTPPKSIITLGLSYATIMEHVMERVIDIMHWQIYCAFILHGSDDAVNRVDEFAPLYPSRQTRGAWKMSDDKILCRKQENPLYVQNLWPSKIDVTNTTSEDEHNIVLKNSQKYHDFSLQCKNKACAITKKFILEYLSHVRWLLHTDVESLLKNDVAATSISEVVLCYPGIRCMLHQRVAHQLHFLGVPANFTRMMTEIAHSLTGIDIHPATSIGHHFFVDHGTGIVIGSTAIIGNHVSIYQGVALGSKSFPIDNETGELKLNLNRHPIVEDDVTIYANAVILGRVTIGKGSIIGGNCWIVHDVPPHTTVVQKSNRVLQENETIDSFYDGSGI